MDETSNQNLEAIEEELETLAYNIDQLKRRMICRQIERDALVVVNAYYEGIDAITQDQRYYL
jgi:hypothetical protein